MTKPFWDLHQIVALVPKIPVRKDFMNFVTVFMGFCWLVFFLMLGLTAAVDKVKSKKHLGKLASFGNSVFKFVKLTFGNLNSEIRLRNNLKLNKQINYN